MINMNDEKIDRKDGMMMKKTYKIEVGEENKDRPFSFSELTPLP